MARNHLTSLEADFLEKAADVLRTVAHPVRLQIIDFLEEGERTVTEICEHLGAQQPYTSQQLALLKAKGILGARRSGNQVLYSITHAGVLKIIQCVRQQAGLEEVEAQPAADAGM
ncbi:MAG: metalloregulator ArsR/SmtB family transcription factor [Syntrophobacteraceae bacterium]|nr:metalloregulator ArsR/SmtB family transcription factor [Syntrophobacteraceae bacterium]